MTTIRRTSKRAQEIAEKATGAKVYSLDNGFRAMPVEDERMRRIIRNEYLSGMFRNAKIKVDDTGKYSLKFHGNLWYTFTV